VASFEKPIRAAVAKSVEFAANYHQVHADLSVLSVALPVIFKQLEKWGQAPQFGGGGFF